MNKSFLNSLLQMRIPFLSLATDCCHLSSQNGTVETDITKAMEEEEESLQLETNKEQQETLQEAKKEWKSMEDKQRYLRLQLLLDKSEIYCKFLQERMEKQRVDAQKHQERMAKKEEKQKRQDANSTQQVPQIEHRVTRSAKVKLRVTSTHPQADQLVPSRRKQGIRRKAQDSSSYMLDKYLDSEVITLRPVNSIKGGSLAKRQKLMDGEKQHEKETFMLGPSSEDDKEQEVVHGSSDVENSSLQPTLVTGGSLRPYQLKGLAWLKGLYENGMNGILADEMGLGKTLQCISMVAFLIEMRVKGPFLVAAPLSTLPNWVHEFHKFTPKIPVILYHGSQEERLKLRLQIDSLKTVEENIAAYPVVVTSYEICMRDQKTLHSLEWKYFIVDEGHRIKNLNCKLIKELKTYNTANRLLLTGTPLQNNLSELWSLLNFLLPDIFDDLDSFQKWFDFRAINEHGGSERIIEQEREHQVLERLHAILTPFLLRRLKSDVALHLPPKKEVLVYAPLTQKQETFYKAALDGTILDLVGDKVNMPGPSAPSSVLNIRMTNILMLLRKCCNHPYLLECPLEEGTLLRKVDEDLVNCSGKMLLLDRMLPSLKEGGHKVQYKAI
ncbi:Lymphoid-specific helicase [Acropora cervicornis]|uniref:Lymphoid-specific helicase n=1 Tax=Acropora cervicornis TaxID=6130 RepID=A0AAD9PRE1_ACRCE|nr:Lymphoid-specific helicase [Acropora cervicornis]